MDYCRFLNKYKSKVLSKQFLGKMMQRIPMIYFPRTNELLEGYKAQEWIDTHYLDDATERILLHWIKDKKGNSGYVIKHVFDLGTMTISDDVIEAALKDEAFSMELIKEVQK